MLSKNKILASLRSYREEHSHEYGIEEIGIFGSYARDM
jgi:predicted nucleotidyltransferase